VAHREGQIRIEYEGRISRDLHECLAAFRGVRVKGNSPLVLEAREPEDVLNRILRYLGDDQMMVRRVELRSARAH